MPSLLIKNVPPELHRRLKEEAARNRRSMTGQTLVLLEQSLHKPSPPALPVPYKGQFKITQDWLEKAIQEGRA